MPLSNPPGAMILLNTLTASSSATLVDTTSLTAAYDNYFITYENVVPATNAQRLRMKVSQDGGGSYLAATYLDHSTTLTDAIYLGLSLIDNTAGAGISGFVELFGVNQTDRKKMVAGRGCGVVGGVAVIQNSAGWYNGNNSNINALQFTFESGNISTGKIRIYGIRG